MNKAMGKLRVQTRWVEVERCWHIESWDGDFIEKEQDCKNFKRVFPNANKSKVEKWIVYTHKIIDDCDFSRGCLICGYKPVKSNGLCGACDYGEEGDKYS